MGQNSTDVAYGFGQLGSAFQNIADKPVYPPKGKVIVAIQFLSSNKLSVLETEVLGSSGNQYISTYNAEVEDNNYLGVCEVAIGGAATTNTPVLAGANSLIQPGQYVLLVNTTDAITTGLTVNAATPTPIYRGTKSAQGVKVLSYGGGTTDLVLSEPIAVTTAQSLIFLDEHHGAGSTDVLEAIFPTGIVIYGRWAKAALEGSDPIGGAIFYFGQ